MKTKPSFFFALMIIIVCLSSCGGKDNKNHEMKVSLQDTSIRGGLSEYFSVVDHEYTYDASSIIDKVKIEVKCLKKLPEDIDFYLGIEVYDESGMPISIDEPDYSCFSDQSTLSQLKEGETTWIEIENFEGFDTKKKTATKIRITSVINEKESTSYVVEETESTDDFSSIDEDEEPTFSDDLSNNYSSSNAKSADYDEMINKYENFVNKFTSLAKRYNYNSQKIIASSEYQALLSSMQEYLDLCTNAKGSMSPSQWSRFSKIAIKASETSQKILENQN